MYICTYIHIYIYTYIYTYIYIYLWQVGSGFALVFCKLRTESQQTQYMVDCSGPIAGANLKLRPAPFRASTKIEPKRLQSVHNIGSNLILKILWTKSLIPPPTSLRLRLIALKKRTGSHWQYKQG